MMIRRLLVTFLTVLALSLPLPLLAEEANMDININTASLSELTELPGIGEKRAEAILADREANGPFERIEDLSRVNGIGEAIVEGLRDHASL